MSAARDVIVVGAGHNGLAAACYLAQNGRKVLVLERREVVGGLAAGETFHPGFRTAGVLHDTTQLRKEALHALKLEKYGLALHSDRCSVFAPQKDGRGLLLAGDPQKAYREIEAHNSRDADRYLAYRAFIDRIRRWVNGFLPRLPEDPVDVSLGQLWGLLKKGVALRRLGRKDMMEVLRGLTMCTADWLDEWFNDDLLKAMLAAPSIFGGYTGPRSPGTNANLILWECGQERPVAGGPAGLVQALSAAAASAGVEVRTGAAVEKVRIAKDGVRGVTLRTGEKIDAGVVMASCDPKHALLDLVESRHLSIRLSKAIRAFRARGTTAKLNLALNGPLSFGGRSGLAVSHARIADNLSSMERAFDAIKYRTFSERPILDVFVPTVNDPGLAPEGGHVVSVLVHFAPYDLEGGWNQDRRERLGDAALAVLEDYAPGIGSQIVAREVLSPADLEARYGLTQGHIFHGEHALDQLLLRPVPECGAHATPLPGFFLCGSGSKPGGGLTCLPGLMAAKTVLKDS